MLTLLDLSQEEGEGKSNLFLRGHVTVDLDPCLYSMWMEAASHRPWRRHRGLEQREAPLASLADSE